jgi:tRNA-modifying protein YgfZ
VVAVRGVPATGDVPPEAWRVPPETPGVEGYDELGPGARLPEGVPPMDEAVYEALRIERGVPRMGSELDETTIPAAAGVVDRAVSFTKGCYTGQELVARIDSRGGNVPSRLLLVATGAEMVPAGAALLVEGEEVGSVTSAAAGVALAYVKRRVSPPAEALARWDGGETRVRVDALPG